MKPDYMERLSGIAEDMTSQPTDQPSETESVPIGSKSVVGAETPVASIGRYRKKPVVIEARLVPTHSDREDYKNHEWPTLDYVDTCCAIAEWCGGKSFMMHDAPDEQEDHILISTLEGDMKALPGDWIIKGVKGEFYPCKPDIFEATYEPSAETPVATQPICGKCGKPMSPEDATIHPELFMHDACLPTELLLRDAQAAEKEPRILCSECGLPMADHACPISSAPNLRQAYENAKAKLAEMEKELAIVRDLLQQTVKSRDDGLAVEDSLRQELEKIRGEG